MTYEAYIPFDEPRICAVIEVERSWHPDDVDGRLYRAQNGGYDHIGRRLDTDKYAKLTKTQLLRAELKGILKLADEDTRAVMLYSNDNEDEQWLAMLKRSKRMKKCFTVKSQMDDYDVTLWIALPTKKED